MSKHPSWLPWAAAAISAGAFAMGALPVGALAGAAAVGLFVTAKRKEVLNLPGQMLEQATDAVTETITDAVEDAYENSATALRAAVPRPVFNAMQAAKNYAEGDSMYAIAEGRGRRLMYMTPRLTGNVVLELQRQLAATAKALNRPDLDPGKPDGAMGPKTYTAIMNFQDLAGKTEPEVRVERGQLRVGPATAAALGFRGRPWE